MSEVVRIEGELGRLLAEAVEVPLKERCTERWRELDEAIAAQIRSEGLPGPADRCAVVLEESDWEMYVQDGYDDLPTVLGAAALRGLPETCRAALEAGASVEVGTVSEQPYYQGRRRPLFLAVPSDNKAAIPGLVRLAVETMRVLLEAGADPNGAPGAEPLDEVGPKAKEAVELLLEAGADPLRCGVMGRRRPLVGKEEEMLERMRQWGDPEEELEEMRQYQRAVRWMARRLAEAVGMDRVEELAEPVLRCERKGAGLRLKREVGAYGWARYWKRQQTGAQVVLVRGDQEEVLEAVSEELEHEGVMRDVGSRKLMEEQVDTVVFRLRGSEWVQVCRAGWPLGSLEEVARGVSERVEGDVLWVEPVQVVLWRGGEQVEREWRTGRSAPKHWVPKHWKEPGKLLGERGVEVVAALAWHNGFWQRVGIYGVEESEVERLDVLLSGRYVPLQEL